MPTRKKRAAIHTLGCRLNQAETGLLADMLKEAGYTIVPFSKPADLGIIHTCTVTHEADAKCRQAIRKFIRRNPCAFTAVVGCYAQLGHKALAGIEGVDLLLGNEDKLSLLDYVHSGKNDEPVVVTTKPRKGSFTVDFTGGGTINRRVNLKIQDGCNNMCSYCIIPFARGRERSRELPNLLDEARDLVARGAKEVVLTGLNVGKYAYDGHGIADVVERLGGIEGLKRLRISSIEPTTIPDALLGMMDDSSHPLVPFLHVPTQSGSNHMLRLMNRTYTREEYIEFVATAHERVRDVCIGTDLLVGAPGETDDDISDTVRLLEETPLAYAHVFKYSERPGTAASRTPGTVDPRVQAKRSALVRKAAAHKRQKFFMANQERTFEVLFEERRGGKWFGYTGNYIRTAVCSNQQLKNVIRRARLTGVRGEVMEGVLYDE